MDEWQPLPVSRTEILLTWLPDVSLSIWVRTSTSPPSVDPGVNLTALDSRLSITCLRRSPSPRTVV